MPDYVGILVRAGELLDLAPKRGPRRELLGYWQALS